MKLMRRVFEVDEKEMAALRKYSGGFGTELAIKRKLWDPACVVLVEDFFPGTTSSKYGLWVWELQIAISGRVEVQYWTCYKMAEWVKESFIAEPGDAFLMDRGDQVIFKVLSADPYRHLCIMAGPPPYPAPPAPEHRP